MPRLLSLVALALLVGCDAAEPAPVVDACPFPVSGFAEPPLLFTASDTLRIGERFLVSVYYYGYREGGNHALAIARDLDVVWTVGAERHVVAELAWFDRGRDEPPTTGFTADLAITLTGVDVDALPAGGVGAVEAAVSVASVACGGADDTTLVTRKPVVLLP